MSEWPLVPFSEILRPNSRPYTLGPEQDANLVGMRLYGQGPFHRELKPAMKIEKKSHFVIRADDIIYNKLFAWKGAFGIVPAGLDGMFVSDKFPTYALDPTKADAGFLKWYFRYPPLWEQARQMSTGSAALSKLTLNPPKFLLLTIPLPSPPEQQRIATKLESLATSVQEAQGLRARAIRDRSALLPSGMTHVFGGMAVTGVLGDVLASKPRNGWSAKCDNLEGGVAVLSLSAVTGFNYNERAVKKTSEITDLHAHYWLEPNDLLITRSNTPELVGHAAIYSGRPTPCIYPDLMMRIPLRADVADTRFVWLWLQTAVAREFIMRNAKGTSPTMKKISQDTVMSIPFPAGVPLTRQREIAEKLESLSAIVSTLHSEQERTRVALSAMMPVVIDRAFKGEL